MTGRVKRLLPVLPLLVLLCLSLTSFGSPPVFAYDPDNWFTISYASGLGPWALPTGKAFQYGGQWFDINDTGLCYFNGQSGDHVFGPYVPQSAIENFTFTVKFLHKKNTFYSHANELIAAIQMPVGYTNSYWAMFVLHIYDADTNNPMLEFKTDDTYTSISAVGPIQNNVWYTFIITYCTTIHTYYCFLNGQYYSVGNWTLNSYTNAWLESGTAYDFLLGAWHKSPWGGYENYFYGYIESATFTDTYTTPYTATQDYLWYHFDEGDGPVAIDEAGGYNGDVDNSYWQWQDNTLPHNDDSFVYTMSGSIHQANKQDFGVTLPENIPHVSDKFSTSMWIKFEGSSGDSVTSLAFIAYLKTFYFDFSYLGDTQATFRMTCKPSGVTKQITSQQINYLTTVNHKWLYLYGQYDGDEIIFTGIWENGTVAWNNTASGSGTLEANPKLSTAEPFGFAGYWGSYSFILQLKFDEFKLTRDLLSWYDMNLTTFGPFENGTQHGYMYNETLWIDSVIIPSTIVCTPTTDYPYGFGTATMYINSSGPWKVNLTNPDILNNVIISPSIMALGTRGDSLTGAWYLPIPITFIATNLTRNGDVFYSSFSFDLKDHIGTESITPFTVKIQREEVKYVNSSSFKWEWSNNPSIDYPVNLYWDTTLTDHDVGYAFDKLDGDNIRVDVISLGFYFPKSSSRGYNNSFQQYWDIEDQYGDGLQYTFTYGIDANVQTYGNFTVTHRLMINKRGDPNDVLYIDNKIFIWNVKPPVTKKIWAVLSVNNIEDVGGVSVNSKLTLFCNWQTKLSWTPMGSLDAWEWEDTYIRVVGSPAYNTPVAPNSTIDLDITMPTAIGPHSREIKVYSWTESLWYNYTTLTVTTLPQVLGVDFSFTISPKDVYFDMLQVVGTPHVTGQLYCTNVHDFYLSISSFTLPPNGLTVSYPTHLGETSADRPSLGIIDISFSADKTRLANGDYNIEFDAYYILPNGSKPYVPQVVVVHVWNANPTITTTTTTYGNITTIATTNLVTVTGMGTGWFRDLLTSIGVGTGWPFEAACYFIGLCILIAIVIIVARAAPKAPNIVHLFGALGAIGLDIVLGLWPMWIAIVLGVFGAALLSFGINRGISGRKESEE